jgi:hypothetical protein
MWVVGFTPWLLYPPGSLGGPQSRSGRSGEEKNSQPLPGLEPLIIQPIAQRYSIEPSRLKQVPTRPYITDILR